MKMLFGGLIAAIALLHGPTAVQNRTMPELSLRIVEASPSGTVTVAIANTSQKPIRICRESNSWGAAHWRVLLIRNGRLQTFFENPDQAFTRNIPTFNEITPGSDVELKLDLSAETWRGTEGRTVRFEHGDTVVVVYDVPKSYGWAGAAVTLEASKMGIWYGVATALITVQ